MNTQYNVVGLADMNAIVVGTTEYVQNVNGNIMDIMENMSHHMMNSSDINELTHHVDATRYTNYPVEIDEEALQQWCDEHLMDYQKDFLKRMEERQWTDEILLRNQY